jgi:hypothetical protein
MQRPAAGTGPLTLTLRLVLDGLPPQACTSQLGGMHRTVTLRDHPRRLARTRITHRGLGGQTGKVSHELANPAAERVYLGAGCRTHQHIEVYRRRVDPAALRVPPTRRRAARQLQCSPPRER